MICDDFEPLPEGDRAVQARDEHARGCAQCRRRLTVALAAASLPRVAPPASLDLKVMAALNRRERVFVLPALVRVAAAVLLLVGAGFGLMSLLSDHPSTPLHEFTVEKTAATASLDEATYLEEIYGPEAPIARQSSGSAHERPR